MDATKLYTRVKLTLELSEGARGSVPALVLVIPITPTDKSTKRDRILDCKEFPGNLDTGTRVALFGLKLRLDDYTWTSRTNGWAQWVQPEQVPTLIIRVTPDVEILVPFYEKGIPELNEGVRCVYAWGLGGVGTADADDLTVVEYQHLGDGDDY